MSANDRPCLACIWRAKDGCTKWDCEPVTRAEAEKRLKTGTWEKLPNGNAECSVCHKYWILSEDACDFKYCPRCGAKMGTKP